VARSRYDIQCSFSLSLSLSYRTSTETARASVENAEDGKGGVKEADGVRDEQALLGHAQDGDEDARGGVGAPQDRDCRQEVADQSAVSEAEQSVSSHSEIKYGLGLERTP
jgi:hypothetical protein